jgi:acyl-CoA-binding protein
LEERRAPLSGWGRRLFQVSFHDTLLSVNPLLADVSAAAAAENFLADQQRFPTQAAKCQFVAEMCMPPPNFDAATACVCNGVGVVVTTTTTTIRTMTGATITRTSVTTHSGTHTTTLTTTTTTTSTLGGSALDDIPEGPATRRLGGVRADGVRDRADAPGASWTDRRLQQATTTTTTSTIATTTTTLPPGQAADGEDEASTSSTTTTTTTGLFDVDGAEKAVGGWTGTAGAYCGAWDEGDPAWCYSNPGQRCASGQVAANGGEYKKSTGPCGSAVESRSEYVLEGRSAVNAPLICAVLLALCLLAVAAGALKITWPVHNTMLTIGRDFQQHATRIERDDLHEQFVAAQQKARQKVKKETSNDMRLALFGLYRQATEGDVRGQRPNFFSSENRAKYDYWAKHRGMTRKEAMRKYIELVDVMVE